MSESTLLEQQAHKGDREVEHASHYLLSALA